MIHYLLPSRQRVVQSTIPQQSGNGPLETFPVMDLANLRKIRRKLLVSRLKREMGHFRHRSVFGVGKDADAPEYPVFIWLCHRYQLHSTGMSDVTRLPEATNDGDRKATADLQPLIQKLKKNIGIDVAIRQLIPH
jgi:hypothetical protein